MPNECPVVVLLNSSMSLLSVASIPSEHPCPAAAGGRPRPWPLYGGGSGNTMSRSGCGARGFLGLPWLFDSSLSNSMSCLCVKYLTTTAVCLCSLMPRQIATPMTARMAPPPMRVTTVNGTVTFWCLSSIWFMSTGTPYSAPTACNATSRGILCLVLFANFVKFLRRISLNFFVSKPGVSVSGSNGHRYATM
jgi:hypothetical protein